MVKRWSRGKSATAAVGEDSLLPPTRKAAIIAGPLAQDKRLLKKWSIDAFFRKVSSILDAQTSLSSLEELSKRHRPKYRERGKSKSNVSRPSDYSFRSREGIDYSPVDVYRNSNNNNNVCDELASKEDRLTANMNQNQGVDALDARLASNSAYLCSSDGSLEGDSGTRWLCTNKVKARLEAKRDQLCVSDSSMDENSTEESLGNGPLPKPDSSCGKRRSRASRTERYLKRMCNGAGNASVKLHPPIAAVDHILLLKRLKSKTGAFQPIDRVPPGSRSPILFFERHMATNQQQQQKVRSTHPVQHQRRNTHKSQAYLSSSQTFDNGSTHSSKSTQPPKPPSRDHTSRVLINGTPMDKYQQMLRCVQGPPLENRFTNAGSYTGTSLSQQNDQVLNHNSTRHEFLLPASPSRSPLKESLNMTTAGVTKALVERNNSPLLDLNQSKYRSHPSSPQDYHNPNYVPHKKIVDAIEKQPIERRSSKNLEEALCELEAIYNSLQLGDEDLLERAEKRTMEEFHYKGFTASLDACGNEYPTSRRKTWADQTSGDCRKEPGTPDRLKDDMAYRRMHPKERPPSTDGQSSLSSISYLMTSPIPSRREMRYIDPKRKSRRKEPDVTLDDVVFRNMQYANNTLKVVEPQPPFGIPLGPITAATESDYLHTNPAKSERSRSPYIPSCEPDIVTDDLAFRNLRKDTQPSGSSSRQPSPSFLHGSITGDSHCTSPLSFGLKKKRAVRSLSANLYGLINKPTSPLNLDNVNQTNIADDSIFDDFFNDVPIKYIGRRTSDPELMCPNWQTKTWDSLTGTRKVSKKEVEHQTSQKQLTNYSTIDLSDESCDESSDERILPRCRLPLAQKDGEHKAAGNDVGSNYLASNCSTPPPSITAISAEPFTEQEISVYKKLCQDLENLVQLTKGNDGISTCSESPIVTVSSTTSDVIVMKKNCNVLNVKKTITDDLSVMRNSSKSNIEQISENSVNATNNDNIECKSEIETSLVKRKISMILDNLKILRTDYNSINSSYSDEENKKKDEENKDTVINDKSFKEITKEICDLVTRDDVKKHELSMKVKESEVDRLRKDNKKKDRIDDNLFFRKVQLAKLSGDWKETTPNKNDSGNAVITSDRRTSLTGGDSISNWEGMTKCNHKYNSMPTKTSSLLPFRHYGSKRKSSNRKSMCTIS